MTEPPRTPRRRRLPSDERASVAVEFALIGAPFILFLMFVFELSFDLFLQESLDLALHVAARQLQTGNAQNAPNAADFASKYLCPSLPTLMSCANVFVRLQAPRFSGSQDFFDYTTGLVPLSGTTLDLTTYGNASFCNSGPAQTIVLSAIYVGPAVVGSMLPDTSIVYYLGSIVHPTLSTTGLVTENYPPTPPPRGAAPVAPAC